MEGSIYNILSFIIIKKYVMQIMKHKKKLPCLDLRASKQTLSLYGCLLFFDYSCVPLHPFSTFSCLVGTGLYTEFSGTLLLNFY